MANKANKKSDKMTMWLQITNIITNIYTFIENHTDFLN